MKNHYIRRRKGIALLGAMVIGFSWGAGALLQAAPPPKVIPPNETYGGFTYAEWSAKWWQWAVSLPIDQNPFFDEGGCANGANGQSGDVWFLTGVINVSGVAERSCTVPQGKALFFPLVNVECSTLEVGTDWYGANEAELRACAKGFADGYTEVYCELDGKPVRNLEKFRVQSPMFPLTAPENNVLWVASDTGYPVTGFSVSDGYWLMLAPLSAGQHTIRFGGGADTFHLKITYHLTVEGTVGPPPKVVPPKARYEGRTYSEWSAAWWQWAVSLPIDQNPFFDQGGCVNGANGQSGKVWFLTGVINESGVADRTCTVPQGKAIFFPVVNVECSTLEVGTEWFRPDPAELPACAAAFADGYTEKFCEVDGVAVRNLAQYRVPSAVFPLTAPEDNVLGAPAGSGFAASDGYWIMLPPLPVGEHTIRFGGGSDSFALDITYHLTVAPVHPAKVLGEYTLPPYSLENFGYTAAELAAAEPNGLTYSDRPAIGSGLQHLRGNWYLGITDRGPNADHFPVDADCVVTPPDAASDGKIFTLPQFAPALVLFQTVDNRIVPSEIMQLLDPTGAGIPGTGNDATDDKPFGSRCATATLPLGPNGMDVEDFALLPGGKVIGVEEYSPSVFIADLKNMQVIKRYTPVGKPLAGASYPVTELLPEVLGANRRNNRGFEGVAVSGDGHTAYVLTQSPLGTTSASKPYANTRVLRLLRLDVRKPLQARLTGQFVVLESLADRYPTGTRQRDLKVSSAAWIATDKLLLLERSDEAGRGGIRLVQVDLAGATDISTIARAQTLDLEDVTQGPAALGITPASTRVVFEEFETNTERIFSTYKLEGLTLRNENEVAISSDNDFGIGAVPGEQTKVWVVRLPDKLPVKK